MLLIALIIYILALMTPLRVSGKKMSKVRVCGGFKQVLYELSGLIFVWLVAFLIIMLIGLTTSNLMAGFELFYLATLQAFNFWFGNSEMSYIIIEITNINSFALVLCLNLIIIASINLLPIPGLAMGNASIAIIESIRKKKFNQKRMRIVRSVCIGLVALFVLFIVYK